MPEQTGITTSVLRQLHPVSLPLVARRVCKTSANRLEVAVGHVNDVRIVSARRAVPQLNILANRNQRPLALLFVRSLESLPEVRRERKHGTCGSIGRLQPQRATDPIQRNALCLCPGGQAGIQQLLFVHVYNQIVDGPKVCQIREHPIRENPDDHHEWHQPTVLLGCYRMPPMEVKVERKTAGGPAA